MRLVILNDFGARSPQFFEITVVHFLAADPVEQHMHRDARARFVRQRLRELRADFAGPVDEGFEGDGLVGAIECHRASTGRFRRR